MPLRSQLPRGEHGFTLVEVLISTVVLGVIASGVGAAIVLFFRTTDDTSRRLALSHDSQLLANYLVPDLDSLTSGQPTPIASGGTSRCPAGFTSIQELKVSFTDLTTAQSYVADYVVTGTVLTRTFGPVGGGPTTTTRVVHNLKSPASACFSPGPAPWTMTVTTGSPGALSNADYTFSVTGGGRVTTPVFPGPPKFFSAASKDSANDGKIDQVIVTFDQPLKIDDTAGSGQWVISGAPGGATLSSSPPVIAGSTVTLLLTGASIDTTSPRGFTVRLQPDVNGIRNGVDQPAGFPPSPVYDGMAPVPLKITSKDTDGDGIDAIVVQFSEPLCLPPSGPCPNPPDNRAWRGATFSTLTPSISGDTVTLFVVETTPADTISRGLRIALTVDPAGIMDGKGNVASFQPTPVSDGAAPVPLSIVAKDTDGNGRMDQVVVTFSEPLVAPAPGNMAPWKLSGQPSGVTLRSVNVSKGTGVVTLSLNEGVVDTAATGFQLALANPSGIGDANGNLSSFGPMPVTDGMSPVLVSVVSTNTTGPPAGTPGVMDTNDTLTLNFSEPLLAGVPANPKVTLTPGARDLLTIAGVATIDLGGNYNASGTTFDSSLTNAAGVLTITLGAKTSGPVAVTAGPAGMMVTPAATMTDGAGNPASGVLSVPGPASLF